MPSGACPARGQRVPGALVQEGRQDAHLQLRLQVTRVNAPISTSISISTAT